MSIKTSGEHLQFLKGGGEMGEYTRNYNWAQTSIGSPDLWPQSLRTTLSIILNSKFPMFLWWGPELICFYNDAYRPSLGNNGKHPYALGKPGEEIWPEIWTVIKPLIDQVLSKGESTWSEDQLIPIYRNGKLEDVYWTFGYSPVNDESGQPAGVLVTCTETTEKVINLKNLKESNHQLEFAIEAAELGMWDYNPVTDKFTANNRLKEWFGLPPETEIGLPVALAAIADKDRERVSKIIQVALEYSSGGNYSTEYTIINPISGKEIIVLAKGKASFDENKNAYRLNGTLQDITEQVMARRKVEESEERFRTMSEGTAILIAVGDEYGNATYFNRAWMSLTGKMMNELTGLGWMELLYPGDRKRYIAFFVKAFEHKDPFSIEFRLQCKDSNYKWLLAAVTPRFQPDGSFAGYISSAIDITERKQAEEALRESAIKEISARERAEISEQRVRTIIENAPFPIGVYVGREMRIEMANQAILDAWGKGNDVVGKLFSEILPELDNQEVFQQLDSVFTTGTPFYAQNQRIDLVIDGELQPYYFNYSFTPLYDLSGHVYGVMNSAADVTDLNLAKTKVEESEKRFRYVADSAPVLIWMAGTDMLCNFFNKAWLSFTGRTMEQEMGNGWMESVHPDDLEKCRAVYLQSFEKRQEFYLEYRLKRHDGEYRWISDHGTPRLTAEEIFEGYIGACMDIHERVIARNRLKENEERLNIVIEASELGMWELNVKTGQANYSDRYLEILGFKKGAVLAHHQLLQRLHPDDKKIRNEAFEQAYLTGSLHYESRLIWEDGSIHWIAAKGKVFYNEKKEPVKLLGTVQDITEEKYSQQELEEREQKFRLLADSMPQFIWTGDAEGNLNYFNQSVYNFSGLTPDRFQKEGWLQIVHPDEREENIRVWLEAIHKGEDFIFEHRFRRHDGEYRWQLSRAIPQKDSSGVIQMWVGTSTDIQDQKIFTNELERQVQERTRELGQKNLELEQMNTELKSFAYVSSHDLQEPLRKIQTFASRILEKDSHNLSEVGRDYFGRIQGAAKRMQALIEDLLAFSRVNSSERTFEFMHLGLIVEEVKAEFKETIQEKGAVVDSGEMCEANIIPFQFRQLMQNLIGNALKFSVPERAPHIIIKSEIANGRQWPEEKLSPNKMYCHISVSDNGIGFEARFNKQIFEIFQRLHGKEKYQGTGIGLAIVKKIVENHNGVITAKGVLNVGATFDIYLPHDEFN
ncbi:PAS domain S-box protein [Runella sp.]|uniref:PAS domain S-box protein n=1 Tax=Runella sp. TaxID=1960881 RepID=UPI003D0ED07C